MRAARARLRQGGVYSRLALGDHPVGNLENLLSLAMLAGLFHLAGPEAIEGRVPTRQWLRIGLIVGGVSMAALLGIYVVDRSSF